MAAQKFLRSIEANQRSSFDDANARAQQQRLAHMVRDQYDGLADQLLESLEFALKFAAGERIKRAERLVHQQNGRIGGQRARNANALALAARKFVRMTMQKFPGVQTDQLH